MKMKIRASIFIVFLCSVGLSQDISDSYFFEKEFPTWFSPVHTQRYATDLLEKKDSTGATFFQTGENNSTHGTKFFAPEHRHLFSSGVTGYAFINASTVLAGSANWSLWRIYGLNGVMLTPMEDYYTTFLFDTISGDWQGDGPRIDLTVAHRINNQLAIGLKGYYQIGTSLKQQYSRAKLLNYSAGSQMNVEWKLKTEIVSNSAFYVSRTQNHYEFQKSWDNQPIYIRQYRSDYLYREIFGDFERIDQNDSWQLEEQLRVPIGRTVNGTLIGRISRVSGEKFDKILSARNEEYPYYENKNYIGILFRYLNPVFTVKVLPYRSKLEFFTQNPDGSILVSKFFRTSIGMKISLEKEKFLFMKNALFWMDVRKDEEELGLYLDHLEKDGKKSSWFGGLSCNIPGISFLDPRLSVNYAQINRPVQWNHFYDANQLFIVGADLNVLNKNYTVLTLHLQYGIQNVDNLNKNNNFVKVGIQYYPGIR